MLNKKNYVFLILMLIVTFGISDTNKLNNNLYLSIMTPGDLLNTHPPADQDHLLFEYAKLQADKIFKWKNISLKEKPWHQNISMRAYSKDSRGVNLRIVSKNGGEYLFSYIDIITRGRHCKFSNTSSTATKEGILYKIYFNQLGKGHAANNPSIIKDLDVCTSTNKIDISLHHIIKFVLPIFITGYHSDNTGLYR
ncbi:hypothetical protein [Francisella sp. 19X1-34]|uniref:hypothetical protein n=1 Tax=Francisella sp. 19X1-34 TaxID=3087177 RepID=UPI002E3449B5|nr:hypothetical protein [Francisella sp. 19X1-34]MED7789693.1 hypothetical protein [Francisella sp. 19X1-34]